MVSGDLFVGSSSRLSFTLANTLSQTAVVLIPATRNNSSPNLEEDALARSNRRLNSELKSGDILESLALQSFWQSFKRHNEWSGLRASRVG